MCQDFVNIYAIMCRELDIPCGSFENDGHTWNII
ncbi:MAG: transglutaminase domain-containing protein [Lachnospiraceae bacterium]|nr:transglutaminase domain-containing protein [Lachnospiraceae bacterium]